MQEAQESNPIIDSKQPPRKRKWFKVKRKPVVSVLRLSGIIGESGKFRKGLNLHEWEKRIEEAFDKKRLQAVALIINSPGGSPVQSDLIYRRIKQLSKEKNVNVITFVEDVAASGGYWLACAGTEIFALPASVVGSIGVIYSGFGFPELIKKWGIERRVITQGKNKSILDSFKPLKEEDVDILKALQKDIHQGFIDMVKSNRGDKLDASKEEDLFSGLFWTGNQALELGLIDGIEDYHTLLRKRFGKDIKLVNIEQSQSFIQRFLSSRMGEGSVSDIGVSLAEWAEERLFRSKFGG